MPSFVSAAQKAAEATHHHVASALAEVEEVIAESCQRVLDTATAAPSSHSNRESKGPSPPATVMWGDLLSALGVVQRNPTAFEISLQTTAEQPGWRGKLARALGKALELSHTQRSRGSQRSAGGTQRSPGKGQVTWGSETRFGGTSGSRGAPEWAEEYVNAGGSMEDFFDNDFEEASLFLTGRSNREEEEEDDLPPVTRDAIPKLLKGCTLTSSIVPQLIGVAKDYSAYTVRDLV